MLVFISMIGPVNASSIEHAPSKMHAVGLNKFDLLKQYTGRASGGDGSAAYRRVTKAMARRSLADAQDAGVTLMRVAVGGYAPTAFGEDGDLDLWLSNPAKFWTHMDQMMNDLDEFGIRLIPVLMWNAGQFPAMANETLADLVKDPRSKSRILLNTFVTDFVTRYRDRQTIYFYELTNELNLQADLDAVARCKKRRKKECAARENISTDDLIVFSGQFAGLIRESDKFRLISSGYSVPRASAEHLRSRPEWSSSGPDWSRDSREQFSKHLKEIHSAVDIISIHLYSGKANNRFGTDDPLALLEEAHRAAREAGKPLFVGEFGDLNPVLAGPDSHVARMIDRMVKLGVEYSAVWVWEFYQGSTYRPRDTKASKMSLEPGYTDYLIDRIREANHAGRRKAVRGEDILPPRVVLTWPLECSVLKNGQTIHAVVSDDSGAVKKVDFLLDDGLVGNDESPPYQALVSAIKLKTGVHRLTARAYDFSGNAAEFSSEVIVGGKATDKAVCASSIE